MNKKGFTIVELLIVIVVIGILAVIVIVSYNGITDHAKLATLQSDLTNATTQLGVDNVNNGVYPATVAAANNGAGLKSSPGTTWQYTYTAATNTYCLAGTNNGFNYYVTNSLTTPTSGSCPLADGSPMQIITNSNCPGTRIRAVDARDNHTYWVQKLADGRCWMLTNLAYAGGGTNTYSDTKSLTDGTSGSATYTVASYYIPTFFANVTSEPTSPSTATNGTGQDGYLYNWCGAMGGQATAACTSFSTPTPDQAISVCPAGWRLPTGNGGEFGALNTAINGGSTTTDAGLLSTWFAQYTGYWNSGFGNQGVDGKYWSSSKLFGAYAYALYFNSSYTEPVSDSEDKNNGLGVRCIAT